MVLDELPELVAADPGFTPTGRKRSAQTLIGLDRVHPAGIWPNVAGAIAVGRSDWGHVVQTTSARPGSTCEPKCDGSVRRPCPGCSGGGSRANHQAAAFQFGAGRGECQGRYRAERTASILDAPADLDIRAQ